jgi:hypothetical protein
MQFEAFMERFSAGDERCYLTASPAATDAHGRPQVAASPASRLLGLDTDADAAAPIRPTIAGNLVPANVNVWMGNSPEASSSGLHHDHHDNLYVLLRGRKRFELYSPAELGSMYTVGHPTRVHANGRINYAESGITEADGDDGSAPARVATRRVRAAELELEAAEEAVERAAAANAAASESAKRRLQLAETALDDAMDAVINHSGRGDEDDEDEDGAMFSGIGLHDSFDDMSDSDLDQHASSSDDDGCSGDLQGNNDRSGWRNGDASVARASKRAEEAEEEEENGDPPSFSRVDRARMQAFPLFEQAQGSRVEAEVGAGEVLYLPAGWFHEVTSLSTLRTDEAAATVTAEVAGGGGKKGASRKRKGTTAGSAGGDASGRVGGHLALNYWFHPPVPVDGDAGGGDPRTYSFETPYGSEARQQMWESDWAMWEGLFAAARNKEKGVG